MHILFIVLQALDVNAPTTEVVQSLSLIDIFYKLGILGQIICGIILLLSVLSVYVFFERLFALSGVIKKHPSNFVLKIKELLQAGNIDAANELCSRTNTPAARVVGKGVSRIGLPLRDIKEAMESSLQVEIYTLENKLSTLSMIARLAPMFGFIGTIIGVIKIFYDISSTGDYNIEVISGGLYNKMITSALGLGLGILAYTFYFFVNNKVDKAVHQIERNMVDFLDVINSK